VAVEQKIAFDRINGIFRI